MARKFCTKHTERGTSTYSAQRKGHTADRYGEFREGRQISNDVIAGTKVWYPVKKEVR